MFVTVTMRLHAGMRNHKVQLWIATNCFAIDQSHTRIGCVAFRYTRMLQMNPPLIISDIP